MAHRIEPFFTVLFFVAGLLPRLSTSFYSFAPAAPTTNNEVDGSLKRQVSSPRWPTRESLLAVLFFIAGLSLSVIDLVLFVCTGFADSKQRSRWVSKETNLKPKMAHRIEPFFTVLFFYSNCACTKVISKTNNKNLTNSSFLQVRSKCNVILISQIRSPLLRHFECDRYIHSLQAHKSSPMLYAMPCDILFHWQKHPTYVVVLHRISCQWCNRRPASTPRRSQL